MKNKYPFYFLATALTCLLLSLLIGMLSSVQYAVPSFIKNIIPFTVFRPLHTLFSVSWIFIGAIGGIFYYTSKEDENAKFRNVMKVLFWLFALTGIGIAVSYLAKNFEGKEYLEFPHFFYFPILLGWILFGVYYFKFLFSRKGLFPAYYWMWGTGIVTMIFHFTEAHLWILPYFQGDYMQNLSMQWKANGSAVGAWNMLVYGTSMYVMAKTSGSDAYSRSKTAFFFYFLSLVNLMFNWAHHVYPIPIAPWIRIAAYVISMTEWLILFSMIYNWSKSLSKEKKAVYSPAHRFMILSDVWIVLNLLLAISISIPAVNYFTHGTHFTVAHAMGTTIGINTLILLSSISYLLENQNPFSEQDKRWLKVGTNIFNISFVCFWIVLIVMGAERSEWRYSEKNVPFAVFREEMHGIYTAFAVSGAGILIGLSIVLFYLFKSLKKAVK
ncbi:MAG: cbb3-type cytochrome c oxidase subunit I [Flavobacteriaceae bacterium]|jgi:nitric oxide reductase subunit B|nr:cbb3-type cytochrome c oxidase subunit I [Flavobacteriaceae bacterium]